MRCDGAIPASKIYERIAVENLGRFYLPNKHRVIARDVRVGEIACDVHQSIFKQRDAGFRPAIANAEFRLGLGAFFGLRKIARDRLLLLFVRGPGAPATVSGGL